MNSHQNQPLNQFNVPHPNQNQFLIQPQLLQQAQSPMQQLPLGQPQHPPQQLIQKQQQQMQQQQQQQSQPPPLQNSTNLQINQTNLNHQLNQTQIQQPV